MSLAQLLREAPTLEGIYSEHLRQHLIALQQAPDLASAFRKVIEAGDAIQLEPISAYKLESMGLVRLEGNLCSVSCALYRLYFNSQNLAAENLREQFEKLQQEHLELQRLYGADDLTQLHNRRHFEIYLDKQWEALAKTSKPLSLILLDVDYFRFYNNTRGLQIGDNCLRLVANAIRQMVNQGDALAVRYGEDEFAVLLPNLETQEASLMAEQIRHAVRQLEIEHDISQIGGLPASVITVSLGMACTVPTLEDSPNCLVKAAEEALTRSKKTGRNRLTVSSTLHH